MNETNCNCCACQYSTPPWWVTMGFTPPNPYAGAPAQYNPQPGSGQVVTAHPPAPPATPTPGTHAGGGIGGLLGTVGNALGGAITNPIGTAGNVLSDVVNGIGSVLGSIF